MMGYEDPAAPLQKALFAFLEAVTWTPVGAEVAVPLAGRVWDQVDPQAKPPMPYVAFGEIQVLDDGAPGLSEAFVTLHAFAQDEHGTVTPKLVLGAVRKAVTPEDEASPSPLDAGLETAGHKVITGMVRDARFLFDPDGVTAHGIMTLRFQTEALDE